MVGWEPVLFQVLWVFKILSHLQLHYDQTVSHVWSNRGQTVECLNFCVECPYFSVECLNFCVVPLPPKIYQFWIILVYFCTCSICIHANKGVPVIATAGHVGQLIEPISHGSWLHTYAGSQTCIGSSALPHVHRMISMHAWTKNKTSSPCCIAFFNLIQQTTFPLQGVNARFEHTFCDEDSMGWLCRLLFQLLLVYISRNDL